MRLVRAAYDPARSGQVVGVEGAGWQEVRALSRLYRLSFGPVRPLPYFCDGDTIKLAPQRA